MLSKLDQDVKMKFQIIRTLFIGCLVMAYGISYIITNIIIIINFNFRFIWISSAKSSFECFVEFMDSEKYIYLIMFKSLLLVMCGPVYSDQCFFFFVRFAAIVTTIVVFEVFFF